MGAPIPEVKGQFFGGREVAAHYKVYGHSTGSCAKTAEPIYMPFGIEGVEFPHGRGTFDGCPYHMEAL